MIERFHAIIDQQNTFTQYQTFEELRASMITLAEAHSDYARVEEIGRATDRTPEYPDGRPIEALLVSTPGTEDTRPWALLQMEHENELPATLAALLIGKVAIHHPELLDELGYNLAIIPAAHPDAIALQRWAQRPGGFDPHIYATGFMRSAPSEQIAWGFPYQYEHCNFDSPTAETQAIMGLMQRLLPQALHSLHANPMLDAYFFSTDDSTAMLTAITNATQLSGFTMQDTDPEAAFMTLHDPAFKGIFQPYTVKDLIHNVAGSGPLEAVKFDSIGTNSYDYLSGIVSNLAFHLSEFPYMHADALYDHSFTSVTRGQARDRVDLFIADLIAVVRRNMSLLQPQAEYSSVAGVNRLTRSINWWIDMTDASLMTSAESAESPDASELLTRSQVFRIDIDTFFALTFAGEVCSLAHLLGNEAVELAMQEEITTRLEVFREEYSLVSYDLRQIVGAQALSSLVALKCSGAGTSV